MKKTLLALALMGAAVSANAAPVVPLASYDLAVNGTQFSFTEGASTKIYEFGSVWDATLDFKRVANQTVISFFEDLDGTFGNGTVDYSNSSLVSRVTLTSALTTAAFALEAGKSYVLTISRDTTGGTGAVSAVATVPVPAAAWLFGSAVVGLGALRRKKNVVLA